MQRKWFLALGILSLVTLPSFGVALAQELESSQERPPDASTLKSVDDLLKEIGKLEPDFGGMFLEGV